MKTRNRYKLFLFADLILSWSLLDQLEVIAFDFEFYSPEDFSIYNFLADNPMDAETVFDPAVKPCFVYTYVISEGQLHSMEVLTLAADTRGPPLFYCVKDSWQAHYDQALQSAVRSDL